MDMRAISVLFAGGLVFAATSSAAEIRFSFIENAPKDRFSIINGAACETGPIEVIIDLSTSAGKLVFDTTEAGVGVEVYQPFDLVAGTEFVLSATPVSDGDHMVHMALSDLPPGAEVGFTIDVDDRLENGALGQTRVAGSEIEGAAATVISRTSGAVSGRYDQRNQVVLAYDACL